MVALRKEAQFVFLSNWKGATAAFTTPAGNRHEGVVTEYDVDPHGIWLHIEYATFSTVSNRVIVQQTWEHVYDVELVNFAPQSKTAAFAAVR